MMAFFRSCEIPFLIQTALGDSVFGGIYAKTRILVEGDGCPVPFDKSFVVFSPGDGIGTWAAAAACLPDFGTLCGTGEC